MGRRLVHSVAKAGFDASGAALYNKVRPSYAPEAVEHALKAAMSGLRTEDKMQHFLEIGAGTGKFTSAVFDSFEASSVAMVKYLAVEPSEGFRSELEKSVVTPKNVALEVLDGTGESLPISQSNSIDAVFVAQAWHWMATSASLREIHRVLRPDRPLVLVWNSLDIDVPWIRDFEFNVLEKYYIPPDIPRYLTQSWQQVFQTEEAKSLYTPLDRWFGGYQRKRVTKQHVWERVKSISVVSLLDKAKQKQCHDEVMHLLNTHPQTRDVKDGEIDLVYKSEVAVVRSQVQKKIRC